MSAAIIEAKALVKSFGVTRALDGLELTVAAGEVHGFLGPNGAGKSTTMRVLLGLSRPDSGTATIFGLRCFEDATAIHRRLAYVPGDVALWPNLTGGEVIDLLVQLRGGGDPARRKRALERFDLDPRKACRTYSKGNRQKVALVAALASRTDLLLFDEPTSGLDPLMESEFRASVAEEKRDGRTVLLSSHILSEVEALADRVTIVRAGKVVESGTLERLRHLTRTWLTVEVSRDVPTLALIPGVHDLSATGGRLRFSVETSGLDEVMRALAPAGVTRLVSQPPTLEDLFLRHYRVQP